MTFDNMRIIYIYDIIIHKLTFDNSWIDFISLKKYDKHQNTGKIK